MFKKVISSLVCAVITMGSFAQTITHVVSGSFTEKVLAEVTFVKYAGNKLTRLAEFNISPENSEFAFPTPKDTDNYRLQVNIYKPGGRHPKLEKSLTIPLSFDAGNNYLLAITASKFNEAKKTGWTITKSTKTPRYSFIKGKILNSTISVPVSLQSTSNGNSVTAGTFNVEKESEFVIPVLVKKAGFYYLQTMRSQVRVFLSPHDNLDISIDNKSGQVESVSGSVINQLLYEWQQLIRPITRYGYNLSIINIDTIKLEAYLNEYEKLQPAMNEFISHLTIKDVTELKAVKNAMALDMEMAPMRLLFNLSVQGIKGWRPRPKDFKEVPGLYKQFITPGKFSNTSILVLAEAREYMNLYAKLNLAVLPNKEREILSQGEKLARMLNAISNDTLKSLLLNDQMGQMVINNLREFKENIEPFKKYARSGPAKSTYESIYNLFSGDTAFIGKSSYNFSLPDTSGKMVSMRDFKGKVVFIDVWATWCGPCKAQIPFLKEIEKEYHDNPNIIFAGISIDRAKDKGKWMDLIRKEGLDGVQLLDDTGKSFAKQYQVNAVPRFLLIGKDGKWIEIRCPLPEAKRELKKYLDKALAE